MTAQPESFGTSSPMDSIARGNEMETLMRVIFPGESEMARRMRAFDWSASALGSTHDWPENLRVAIRLCLTSRFPICLWWARPLRFLYNDAFLPWLSDTKHPRALMELGREVWSEDWHIIGPMLERVIATGDASWSEEVELYHNRKVPQEEVYITWSFTPILAADGHTVDGIFCPCSETTEKVIGARRLETLRKLAVRAGEARSVDGACDAAVAVMGENARDIPFAAIYVAGANGDDARLSATALPPGEHSLPSTVRASDDDAASPWPLARVLRTKRAADCLGIDARGVQLHAGPWRDLTQTALIVPIHAAQDDLAGLLVVGVSPRRPLDAAYRTFFNLVAGHIATAISGAQAYEAQRERAEALAQIDRAKTAFFSNVSHEFRTPLTLLLGPLEDELRENPRAHERLEVAHRNALRLVRLVNTLLDFSRIEVGRIEAVYEPTDLAAYTTELAGVFRSAIEKAGLKLLVECPPLPEPVYVDREMWEKIVLNLLSNAFKFTFEGEINVSLRWCGERVEFCLSDTGVGVPAPELPRIFERFHRVRETRARTFEGTGIGLALVQELVKLHSGEIKVQSEEGRGTSFLVSLPTGSAHVPKERVGAVRTLASTSIGTMPFVEEALRWLPDEENTESGKRKDKRKDEGATWQDAGGIPQSKIENRKSKILLADDNADMRDYVRRLLNTRFEVIAVADGEAALAAACEHNPDLVLADVMMPRLDGFGLLKALRKHPRTRDVPVVMLSARAGEESSVEGLQAGADDYLIKPFSARELLARVSARLEIARLNREALEREHKLRVAAEDAEAEVARKNQQLQEARARTEAVLASVTDTHILFDRQWRYVYVNEAAARAIGLPAEHILGLGGTLWELFPDIVGTELDRQYHRAMDERVPVVCDFYYSTRDTWWANRFYPTPDGLAVFATDITERKRAEEALRRAHNELEQRVFERTEQLSAANAELSKEIAERKQAEEELRKLNERIEMILDSITDNFFAFDQDWRFTYFNKHAEKQLKALGKDPARLIGKVTWEEFQADPAVEEVFRRAMHERAVITHEHYFPPLGEWVENRIYPGSEGGIAVFQRYVTERKRAEDELRRSEAFLAEGQRISHTGSWSVKLPSEDVFWSQELFRIYGLDPATTKLSQQMVFQLIHPEDRLFVKEAFERAVRDKSDFAVEHRAILADGSIKYFHALGHPVLNESGDLIEYVGTVVDITERKRVEEELRRANAKITEILESITDGFSAWDQNWRYIYANERSVQLLGKPREQLIGRSVWDLFPEAVGTEAYHKCQQAMAERLPVDFEACFYSRWYENYVYPTKEGLSVYWREITDRKRAEAALRRSEAYLAEGQKISHTGSWAWNVSTGELFWSVEHFRIFGLDPENFTPTIETARQLIHPEDAPAAIRAFDGAIRERNDFQWDFRIVRPDGTIRYVRSLGHPAFNESGDLIEYVGTIMDTTERKRAEEELRKTEAELTHVTRLTTMGELAASIAHEINQPLGAIVNNGNVAMRLATAENGSLDKLVEVLSDVVSDANRTSAIIARIRSVMRKSAPEKTSLQLKDLVADVLALAQRELAERRIEVRTELPEDLPRVSGDRVQLHQVLLNLVMNAIDAMDDMEERRRILKIEGRTYEMAGDPAVLITVQDLGCGFKPEDSERLFEPFYTTKTGRMGMGLRISRSIVEAHGGHLWATSNDGEGATFHFALPVGERDET